MMQFCTRFKSQKQKAVPERFVPLAERPCAKTDGRDCCFRRRLANQYGYPL